MVFIAKMVKSESKWWSWRQQISRGILTRPCGDGLRRESTYHCQAHQSEMSLCGSTSRYLKNFISCLVSFRTCSLPGKLIFECWLTGQRDSFRKLCRNSATSLKHRHLCSWLPHSPPSRGSNFREVKSQGRDCFRQNLCDLPYQMAQCSFYMIELVKILM